MCLHLALGKLPALDSGALVQVLLANLLGLMAEDGLERGLLLKGGDGLLRRTTGIASLADVY